MSEELKGNGHCETLIVDDEPTEGVSRQRRRRCAPRAGRAARRAHPSLPSAMFLLLQPASSSSASTSELSTEMWCSVMRQAGEMGILQVHLSGGEPTARKDLEQIVSAASEAGLYSNLITAAVTLNRRPPRGPRQARARSRPDLVPGRRDAENAERIGAYPGATQKKLDVARWVTELGLPLTINAPIHRHNIHNVGRYIELAVKLGAQRLEIAHVQYYGWAYLNRAALIPTYEETVKSIEFVERERERLKGVLTIDMVVPDYYAKRPKPCMGGWGKGFMNITPAGKVLPCHAAETIKTLRFDNVQDRPLLDIWLNSEAFNAFRGTDWMKEPCRSCAFRESISAAAAARPWRSPAMPATPTRPARSRPITARWCGLRARKPRGRRRPSSIAIRATRPKRPRPSARSCPRNSLRLPKFKFA